MATKIVVVEDPMTGEQKRFNLSGAQQVMENNPMLGGISQHDWSTGVDLEAVYLQPRARRVIVEFYSRWDDGHGRVRGGYFQVADNDLIARIAKKFDCEELAALLPEYVDA